MSHQNPQALLNVDVHWLFLGNLNDEYCTVVTTGKVLSSL
jgi:hypothetical protein